MKLKIIKRRSKTHKNHFNIYIDLPNKRYKKIRKVGHIDLKTNTFQTTPRKRIPHLMRCNNSLGFCYPVIKKYSKKLKYICVPYENKKLWTTFAYLLKHGTFLHFALNGLEKQIFLNINKFSTSKQFCKTT